MMVPPDRALNGFTAAAGRLGHSRVPETILLATPDGPAREVPLADCFFDRFCLGDATFEGILYGARLQPAEAADVVVTDALRNALLPGFGLGPDRAADLLALNIQRGRDHGVPDYFKMLEILGLGPAPADAAAARALLPPEVYEAYGIAPDSVTDVSSVEIDLLVGLFGESRPASRLLGETGRVLWALQFLGLSQDYERSVADRFVAAPGVTPGAHDGTKGDPFADWLDQVTMAGLLAANTGIAETAWHDSFRAPIPAPVPTPDPALLVLTGLFALAVARRARRAAAAAR